MNTGIEFDYLILGAGTAGCVLAARLSEDPSVRVALVEAGPPDRHPFIHVPALVGAAISRPQLNWRFLTVPQPALDQRSIAVPRGHVVGGSGSINGMVYFRGQPVDYDEWAAEGCEGWSWREVLPYFIRSEDNPDYAGSPWHGQGGPIRVAHIPKPNALNRAFLEAFESVGGYSRCDDFNGPRPEGYGPRQGTIREGRRDSSAQAFLAPALSRPNLTLLTDHRVLRLLVENGRVTGVEVLVDGSRRSLRARAETALCAGAVQSPQLLMLSGIGDARELSALNIPVVLDQPSVGANYHDHLAVAVLMETANTTSYGISLPTLPRSAMNLLQYAFGRRGPLASNVFESTAFIRSDESKPHPDLQIVFQPARRNRGTFPLPLGHGFAISSVSLYPKSRGRIRLASADPLDAPLIDPNLLGEPEDIAPLLSGLRLSRRLLSQPSFAAYHGHEVSPGPQADDDAALAAHVRRTSSTVHHPGGSCRMGSDAAAVVDPQLRLNGLAGLRIVDGSVMPRVVGGNTNAPIVMIAEKAADLMRGRAPPAPLNI
ncbi:MAG: GMC family oxidoreductase N-terminal domain-containing protein [Nevskiaceae bacterium]|nr:GMC family oxidoreductase N-terminal domain-containing protein [Nevskiaceae bacterium]